MVGLIFLNKIVLEVALVR